MKKYLMSGAMALVVSLFVTSCSHEEDYYVNSDVVKQKKEAYNAGFKEVFGTPATNQDWGFDQAIQVPNITPIYYSNETEGTKATTRTVDTNSNEWEAKGYNVPSEITAKEKEVVMKWFTDNKNPKSETIDLHNYFVQNVGYTEITYKCKDNNKAEHSVVGCNQMDYIFCGPGASAKAWNDPTPVAYTWDNGDEHINNFNANSGTIQHILYTGTEWFGYHESFNTSGGTDGRDRKYCKKDRNFVIRFIEVDGVKGCYVGFDYECHGNQGDVNPDGYFNDRVIKIVAAEDDIPSFVTITQETTETEDYIIDEVVEAGRVFCEDLGNYIATYTQDGTFDRKDLDFNDVVFNATIIKRDYLRDTYVNNNKVSERVATADSKYFAKIDLYATGGTFELSVLDQEVHKAFNVGKTYMVNTVDYNTKREGIVGSYNESLMDPVSLKNDVADRDNITDYDEYLFDVTELVKVNKDNTIESVIQKIPIVVRYGEETITVDEITSHVGDSPRKIMVPISTRWASERCPIGPAIRDEYLNDGAYERFTRYVTERYDCWSETPNNDYVYFEVPLLPLWKDSEGNAIYAKQGVNRTEITDTGKLTEYVLFKNNSGQDVGSGIDIVTDTSISKGNKIRVYGNNLNIELTNQDSQDLSNNYSITSGNGYIEFNLNNEGCVNKLRKQGKGKKDYYVIVIIGSGTVTKVALIR